jgi:hypothetical protein
MTVGIMPTDRNDGIPWIHTFQPIKLQGATGTMVRDFHDVDAFGQTVLAHTPQGLSLHIGCEKHPVGTAGQMDDDGTIIEHVPFHSPACR